MFISAGLVSNYGEFLVMHTDTLSLVGQIYEAIGEQERWNDFLGNLSHSMNAIASRMRMIDKRDNCYCLVAGNGHDDLFDKQYNANFTKVDVWNPILNGKAPGELFNSSEFVQNREFRTTEIYNDFFRNYDLFYGLGSNIAKSDSLIARIGIHRAYSQGEFSQKEKQLLISLLPHLQRAFKLSRHLEEMKSLRIGMEEALYHSTSPLILLDEYGKVIFTNQRAEMLIAGDNGLFIHNNQLATISTKETRQLDRLVQEAVATGSHKGVGSGAALRLSAANGEQRYNLLVTPYPDHSASHLGLNHRICAAVFIHDSKQTGRLPADVLKAIYSLTPSEIRLAEAILDGLSPADAASKFGVSVNTTRTQLRSLFAKTDTKRQPELVRLLIGLTR